MQKDRQGNPLAGATAEAADNYVNAIHAFNLYRGDPVALVDKAIDAAPEFTKAHILKAWLYATATEPEASAEATNIVAHAKTLQTEAAETAHLDALDLLLTHRWNDAAVALDRLSMQFPYDIVALQIGHLLDFFRGNSRNLRDRISRALPQWSEDMPGYSIVLGWHAFGLEESGDYARAEEAGRRAVELEPLDCWAHHAVAHVLEMQGRATEGVSWMVDREAHWSGEDNFFQVHNWWHRALFHLDLGQADQAIAIYDQQVRSEASPVAVDLVDAAALLWRMSAAGLDVGDRWQEPADAWSPHADGKLYPYNDWHAVMANLGAGRDAEVSRITKALKETATFSVGDVSRWASGVALPVVEGFVAFWRGEYVTAVEKLHPVRYVAHRFGGSNAQRDIIDWTLTEAAIRGGLTDVAESLAQERMTLKPSSGLNRSFLSRARGTQTKKAA